MAKAISAITTMNIIPTKFGLAATPTGRWGAWVLVACCAVLVLLALPSFMMRIMTLAGNHRFEKIQSGEALTDSDYQAFVSERTQAWQLFNQPDFADQIVLAQLTQHDLANLDDMIGLQEQSLAKRPANPHGWVRLAYLYLQRDGVSDAVLFAYNQAEVTGKNVVGLMAPRIILAVFLDKKLSKEQRTNIPAMIRLAWQQDPDALVKAAKNNNFISLVESALKDMPVQLGHLKWRLSQLKSPVPSRP